MRSQVVHFCRFGATLFFHKKVDILECPSRVLGGTPIFLRKKVHILNWQTIEITLSWKKQKIFQKNDGLSLNQYFFLHVTSFFLKNKKHVFLFSKIDRLSLEPIKTITFHTFHSILLKTNDVSQELTDFYLIFVKPIHFHTCHLIFLENQCFSMKKGGVINRKGAVMNQRVEGQRTKPRQHQPTPSD